MFGTRKMCVVILMAAVIFSLNLAAWAGEPARSTDGAAESAVVKTPVAREGKTLQTAVKDAQKRWNKVKPEQAEDAAHDFLLLHDELQADTKIADAEKKKLQKTVRVKLAALSRQIAKNVEKENAAQNVASSQSAAERPETVKTPENKPQTVAAQRLGGGGLSGGDNEERMTRTDRLARIGGEQLVEVILKTIKPDSWEENGGRGTIIYWGTQRYLIITQTDEVHEQIGGLMGQLRR